LSEIVTYIKKSKIGNLLEYLADYYILKYELYNDFDSFGITLSENSALKADKISDGEYKLAYICELVMNQIISSGNFIYRVTYEDVYRSFSRLCYETIEQTFKLETHALSYKEIYLLSILDEFLDTHCKNKKIRNLNLQSCYFFAKQIIKITNIEPSIIYNLQSLMTHIEDIKLQMFTGKQIQELLEMLGTNKRLYLKILLVISYEILRKNEIIDAEWLRKKSVCKNLKDLKFMFNDIFYECVLLITSNVLKNEFLKQY